MRKSRQNSDVQRYVTARRIGERGIGRVGRVHRRLTDDQTEEPDETDDYRHRRRKLKRRSGSNRSSRLGVLAWSLLALSVTVGVLVAAFLFWLWPQMKGKDASWRKLEASERNIRVATKFAAPSPEAANKIVASALAVTAETEVDQWIRTSGSPAAEVVAFMKNVRAEEGAPTERIWLGSIDRNGMQLEGIELIFRADGTRINRLALLLPDDRGVWKMDFGAFARAMKPSWEELISHYPPEGGESPVGPPPAGYLRALFVEDNYYNGPFIDDQTWVAFGMLSPDHQGIQLIGYCKRDSLQHKAMKEILAKWPTDVLPRITVEVRRVAGAEPRQLEITGVLAEDWVVGDRKFEELVEQGWR
jgi:hypothetical protein